MHYVFLVHGSVSNQPGWAQSYKEQILDKAKLYTSLTEEELKDKVTFVEINYAAVLDENIKRLIDGGESLGNLNKWLKASFIRRKQGLSIIETQNDKALAANVILEFTMDALAYLWNPDMERFVLLTIANQVLNVAKKSAPDDKFSFIGHGIGTKVLFDFLHQLYLPNSGVNAPYSVTSSGNPTHGSLSVSYLYLLGNVAQGLSTLDFSGYDQNRSHVRLFDRNTIPKQGGVVRRGYRIYTNPLDWLSRIGASDDIKDNLISNWTDLKAVTEMSMHQMSIYLDHPAVHIPLVEDLFMKKGEEIPGRQFIINEYDTQRNMVQVAKDLKALLRNFKPEEANNKTDLFGMLKNLAEVFNT